MMRRCHEPDAPTTTSSASKFSRPANLTLATKLVAFHVEEHNHESPHSAFRGQTPDETYFATGDGVPDEPARERAIAKQKRIDESRALACAMCDVAKNDSDAA